MAAVRKCYNEKCECNIDGAYCDADEIKISEDGMCENFYPKVEETGNENS